MKIFLSAIVLALTAMTSQAAVVSTKAAQAKDVNGDGNFDAYWDQANGLLWSSGDAFSSTGYTYVGALAAVAGKHTEGMSGWRLPTVSEFQSLFRDVPRVDPVSLTTNANWYWTSDIFPANTNENLAFEPTHGNDMAFFRTTRVGVWEVTNYTGSTVPEPASVLMLLTGLGLVAAFTKKRASKVLPG